MMVAALLMKRLREFCGYVGTKLTVVNIGVHIMEAPVRRGLTVECSFRFYFHSTFKMASNAMEDIDILASLFSGHFLIEEF